MSDNIEKADELNVSKANKDEEKPVHKPTGNKNKKVEKVDIDKLQAKKKKLEQELNSLKGSNKKLKKKNQQLQETITALREDNSQAEDLLAEEATRYEREKEELSQELAALKRKLRSLQDTLQNRNLSKDDAVASGKSPFTLEIYPHEGKYQGRIKHLLSEEVRNFKEFDRNAVNNLIFEFISGNLPGNDACTRESVRKEISKQELCSADAIPGIEIESIIFTLTEPSLKSRVLPRGQSFKAYTRVESVESYETELVRYDLRIFAKHLTGGEQTVIGTKKGNLNSLKGGRALIDCIALECGSYRLEAVLNLETGDGTSTPFSSFYEAGFLQII